MKFLIILCVLLLIIIICLAVHIARLKSAMKDIGKELILTRYRSYDRQITIPLFDKSLTDMTSEINRSLYFQKKLKLESERSEETMRRSVSDIAHDIRTPLTVINGNLQLMEYEGLGEEGREHLRICREKTALLKTMTDEFFELAVLESNDAPAETVPVDITAVFLQFMADNEAVISRSGLVPEITFPEKSIFINADEHMLMRMLGNLLNNVIKYAKGTFSAGLYEKNNKCTIFFSNELRAGNIPDPELIFERSYRGDRARNAGNAGLGLYIVKLLAGKQGAAVGADTDENRLTLKIEYTLK